MLYNNCKAINISVLYIDLISWVELYMILSMSEDVISATNERSERVADIISERIDKNHIQIHPLL